MPGLVDVALHDGVATLTLNDGKANALSLPMSQAIAAGLDQAAAAKVVVLRGRPGVLCGGFDLKVIRAGDAAQREAMTEAGYHLLSRLYLLPQPLVIACTGHAVAAGALLLLTADLRIGTRGAFRIGLNETAIGLSLPPVGLELARDRLLPTALTAATLGATLYGPEEAATIGYLDDATEADSFEATLAATVARLQTLDGTAFAATKQRLRHPFVARLARP